jgi:type II secretory pathway component GspD/PulD (secretin)
MYAQDLILLIQDTTDWENWADTSETGEGGRIFAYPSQQPKKLAVFNTPEIQTEVEELLNALRKSLGHQVSIEARFLVVTENFLEEIGLDVDFDINLGNKWGLLTATQESYDTTALSATDVSLSLGDIGASATISGGYGNILDDLQVAFLLRATQAHRDAKSLNAPRATVLSGETVNFQLSRYIIFALPPLQQAGTTTVGTATGTTTGTGGGLTPQYYTIQPGNALYITPIITHDKKNVLLNISTVQNQFLGLRESKVEIPTVTALGDVGEVQTVNVEIPETEYLTISTRVNVPDGGTLLLGGQKITAESDIEAGVPILGKVPIIGRLFRNTSKIRDQKILLVLVKATILLQDEQEAIATGAMENGF